MGNSCHQAWYTFFLVQDIGTISMGIAVIIHNPRSGGRLLKKGEGQQAARRAGLEPLYFELEDSRWMDRLEEAQRLIVAGGDGTIAQVVREQIRVRPDLALKPLQILPLGMSNNLFEALRRWASTSSRPRSGPGASEILVESPLGQINVEGRIFYFLEGLGWGLIAELIHSAYDFPLTSHRPEDRRREAWQRLFSLPPRFPEPWLRIRADGRDRSGSYALVEVLPIPYIGPRIALALEADPGQDCLYLVRVPNSERVPFLSCLRRQLEGQKPSYRPQVLAFREASLSWGPQWMHQDDKAQYYDQAVQAKVSLWPGKIPFILA